MAARSAAEEELWRQEQSSWDHLKAGNLRGYLSLLHDDVMAWPRHASAPMNKDAIFQHVLPMISAFQSPGVTIDLEPLSIRVFGNVGIAQYQADIQLTPKRSTRERLRFARTWLRTEDGWRLIAGMNAPLPGS
jgi:uncharacterized protein (TIGR02246 family)